MEKPSDRNREQEDGRLFRKYNIRFRGPAYESPAHHIRAFQHISVLGTQRFLAYYPQDSMKSLEPGERLWKGQIKSRTQRLVKVTERNVGNSQSEMKWRLDLEKIVYSRFEYEIECPEPTCKGRWWRSQIEVVPEMLGPITTSIKDRQSKRIPCRCTSEARLENMQVHFQCDVKHRLADRVESQTWS